MNHVAISAARDQLSALVDAARQDPMFLTRHRKPVVALVNPELLAQLQKDAEELADIRAVDSAWQETQKLDETPIPWEDVKRELGL